MFRTSRAADLWNIAGGLAAAAVWLYGLGLVFGSSILQFAGFMAGACTFLPLPADAYILDASTRHSALVIGVVGALIGGLIATGLGAEDGVTGFNIWSFAVAVGGAVLLLVLYRAIRRN